MKLALYGGTFDPIHLGHLVLAREALERLGLDRVVFIPTARSPFKPGVQSAPPEIRLAMARAAIDGEPGFEVDGSEIERGGISYTIDTVLSASARWPGAELYWLLGRDHVAQIEKWHRYTELCSLVRFAVFDRDSESQPAHDFPRISRRIDISATEIRARVAKGQSIRYLVPESVRSLIERHGLYQHCQ